MWRWWVGWVLLLGLARLAAADGLHYGIEVDVQWQADAEGRLTGLRMQWVYDAQASRLLIDGEDISPNKQAASLKFIADLMLADLRLQHYYTRLSLKGQSQPLAFAPVREYQVHLLPGQRLVLELLLPLASAQTLAGQQLTLALAEPLGNAALRYREPDGISLGASIQALCQATLAPQPASQPPSAQGGAVQLLYLHCR